MKELQEIRQDILNFRNFELITKNKELEILHKLNKIEKQLSIYSVSQQSELLAFDDWCKNNVKVREYIEAISEIIERYKKANCG